jgi:hypothetical protein
MCVRSTCRHLMMHQVAILPLSSTCIYQLQKSLLLALLAFHGTRVSSATHVMYKDCCAVFSESGVHYFATDVIGMYAFDASGSSIKSEVSETPHLAVQCSLCRGTASSSILLNSQALVVLVTLLPCLWPYTECVLTVLTLHYVAHDSYVALCLTAAVACMR